MTSPSKIGRYEVTGTLGKGAMGVVYKAVDPTIGRVVALKTARLDVHGQEQQEMLARFRNEARLAGVLNHPNIVTVYDAGEHESLFYIAMEYIEGQTLHQFLSKKKILPIEQVIAIAKQVCAGLDAAAVNKIVHRDIKPANIMIEADGTAKIMDFGIAKSEGGLTSTGQVLGTPNYMSPEQVRGKPLDGRSDLFSLGVILYEMVTGTKPFLGDNVTTIIYKIINEDPPRPREVNVSVHPGMERIILKSLEKNSALRYQSGAELARDLENYKLATGLDDPTTRVTPKSTAAAGGTAVAPALAAKASSAVQKIAEAGKKPVPLLPMAAGVLVLLGAVVFGILTYVHRSQAQQRAELEQLLAEQKPKQTAAAATPPQQQVNLGSAPSPVNGFKVTTESGELILHTNPEGATVRIDGKSQPTWVTPLKATSVPAGAHTISFLMSGYSGETRVVDVSAGRQAVVAITLKQHFAGTHLGSNPTGAEIYIDGIDAAKTTPSTLQLAAGDHSLLLRKGGYADLSTTIHLKDGQAYDYSPDLQPAQKLSPARKLKRLLTEPGKVQVQVKTVPKGAHIIINGVTQSGLSPFKTALDPGSYDVILQVDGFKTLHKTVTVEKDTPLEIDEFLQKEDSQ